MIYVISKTGKPLMPTENYAKVRVMLKTGKAKCVKRTPFTIQLQYDSEESTQEVTLGVDAGSKVIGLSACTKKKEVYAGELHLRTDIVKLLSTRREMRRTRRSRKTRHRKARFLNRKKSKGWLAPSIRHKINCHLKIIEDVHKILPISKIIVETAAFDIQKLKADLEGLARPKGKEYQEGEQKGFWNAREYVLHRDGHKCRCCKGKSKDKILEVHHIESRITGGDAPNNLVTLCETCHDGYHSGKIKLPPSIKRGNSFRDATFMGIMRWAFYDKLKEIYPDVKMTFGYITKNVRIENKLPKSHMIDARCIAGHPNVKPLDEYFLMKKIRCHNRQIHKMTIGKSGYRKRNQAEYKVFGFRLFDKVTFENEECFIFARRERGYFDIRKLNGIKVHRSANYKKLKLIEKPRGYLTERRKATFTTTKVVDSLPKK